MKKILLTMAIQNSLLLNSSFLCYDFNANSTNIIKESKEINFLTTADIHAGYEDSYSSQTISAIAKKLSKIIIVVLWFQVI
ncbi:hypothetical protein [Spiroplasma endosymbiont of Virgichneumon dumeticola]|uniref:hypothetical protein n=1 Tax=Spiroplasma endosymbiont of Virgichneumon dumeticola TaxID=3139323 RepID=UPI0035C9280F